MSITELDRAAETERAARLGIVDCDVHPVVRSLSEQTQFLPERWRNHLKTYGPRIAQPFAGTTIPYPRMTVGNGRRLDSWPPNGGPPGGDLDFMRAQHLDANDVRYGLMHPLATGHQTLDLDLGAAMCAATNDWQLSYWTSREPRLKASIAVTQEDPQAAVAEIERHAGNPAFAQIAMPPRTIEPLGRRRYWPIYEAAQRHGLPIAMHNSAYGPHPTSGSGWVSFYLEDHYVMAHDMQSAVTSLVMEGVFERYPGVKVVLVEGGFAWAAGLAWRLDRMWERMRSEVPHVKRPPSEYMRTNIWYTTQPMEEPETPEHLLDIIRWIGEDRLLFSTDYPHWDFDDPRTAFKTRIPKIVSQAIFRDNAMALYRFA